MKSRWRGACIALAGLSVSALAHAQGVASAPAAAPTSTAQPNMAQQSAPAQAGTANDSPTRAQVYHELVQAERDGQLQTLDKTLYAHH